MHPDSHNHALELLSADVSIFDTETTGLSDTDEIVEIAIVSTQGTTLFNTLIRPTFAISNAASAVHGIKDDNVRHAPTIVDLIPKLRKIMQGHRITSYNLAFDVRMLEQSCVAAGIEPFGDTVQRADCIMELYAVWWGDWNDFHKSYTWQPLGRAIKQCELETPEGLHRALADAKGALAVLNHIAQKPEPYS